MTFSKTLLPLIWASCLDYDVEYFKDCRIKSIRIPNKRLEKLKKLGVNNCFTDPTSIYESCEICKNTTNHTCHAFRSVKGLAIHTISQHKTLPIIVILEALSEIEIKFLRIQGVNLF